ncbi:outer membrane biogenesis protein BamB [Pirellula sp. SH-Sr6A]|uniref:outer membrane protein assembly factor BamB family protein n=1 Tax=Pirellula sp. SH-Sr6A TaxID=1632865 RepID=UPI00078B5637|nr:PQQ-binding-like beta-propeller repeat protein [Pirellula sp. SH-Sr6A]AMV32681.1 outer membrane biogenesis protein BamB [Pirellula sp. SH-Sr6A]
MFHENTSNAESETFEVAQARRRWSMLLLAIFTSLYGGFIALCAFAYQWFSQIQWLGVPAPVWYGLGLIFLALAIAGLYGHLTRLKSTSALCLVALSLGCCLGASVGYSEDKFESWTRFRGPNGQGVAPANGVEVPWKNDSVKKVSLPGSGHGSPAVWGDRAFLMSADPKSAARYAIAVDLKKSEVAWSKSFDSQVHALHKFSSYASSTPCVDAENVYYAWADPEHTFLKAFSHDGEEVWSRDFGRYVSQHGFGTSPIRVEDVIILLNSQDSEELPAGVAPGFDRMTAVDFRTGETRWETKLPTSRVCYGVPAVWEHDGKKELVCSTTLQGMFGVNPATGEILWNHDCFTQRVCSSSVIAGDLLLGTHGSGGGRDNRLVAFDLVQKKERFRVTRSAPYVPSPLATGDTLFLWSDAGIVSCVDAADGKVLWNKRIGGDYSGSPIILGDLLMNVSHTGAVQVLRASREFEQLATIETELTVRSTMVPTQDHLLLRGESELWIIPQSK